MKAPPFCLYRFTPNIKRDTPSLLSANHHCFDSGCLVPVDEFVAAERIVVYSPSILDS